jgi:hypothetical protein
MKQLLVAAFALMSISVHAQDLKSLKKAFDAKKYQDAINIANALQPAKAEEYYWIHKANYQTLVDTTLRAANPNALTNGVEAFAKMMSSDKNFTKYLLSDGIVDYTLVLNDYRNAFITNGSKAFDAKDYISSGKAFGGSLRVTEITNKAVNTQNLDTIITFYAGYSYDQAKNNELAEKYYSILVDKNCKGQDLEISYQWMANYYLNIVKDEVKGKQYLDKGLANYPNDKYLQGLQSDMYALSNNPEVYEPFFQNKIASKTATPEDMINYSGKLFDIFFAAGKPKTDSVAQFAKLENIVATTYALKPNNVNVNYMKGVVTIQKLVGIESKLNAIKGKSPAELSAKKTLDAERFTIMEAAQKNLEFIHTVFRNKARLDDTEKAQYALSLQYLADFYSAKKQLDKVKEVKEKLKEIKN